MVRKSFYILISILLTSLSVKSQTKNDQDFIKIYYHTFKEERVDKMLRIGDSIYQTSDNEDHKIRSLVIMGTAYSRQLNASKSIKSWKKIDSMAKKSGLSDWEALANERLASEYLKLNLLDASKQFLNRAKAAGKSLSNSIEGRYIYAMLLETEALQNLEEKDTVSFIKKIKNNQAYLEKIQKNEVTDFLLGKSYLKLGEVYVQKNSLDSANNYFHLADKKLRDSKIKSDAVTNATYYRGLGNIALKRKKYDEAEAFLLKAKNIAFVQKNKKESDFVINDLRKLYRLTHNHERLLEISPIKDSIDLLKKNELVALADQDFKEESAKKNKFAGYFHILIYVSAFLFLVMVGLYFYYKKQKRKNRLPFEKIINDLNAPLEDECAEIVADTEPVRNHFIKDDSDKGTKTDTETEVASSFYISVEKEEELVKRMKDFEHRHLYLDKKISRPKMASLLNTNTKYLSYIIKKYKKLDFSEYINHNRINYITKKLYKEPEYRNYKISYLAEICGYSSHSRFADIFKRQMNISPSEFIAQLQNRAENKF
ncbi:AraC-like DNA-binding protein [Chryseobacterium vietnamense]|uniref:AraC family transcriptional regulator n=1 Tax=Chryseobacterium vietnamense TaxID=866785 RepID=UPI002863E385|nr:AraC family transcriptional regulator [Chryseobacterium vietnamense]MDR6489913.1 AraC-like DNA-binding protein [Chryseobacterium vietnamense]